MKIEHTGRNDILELQGGGGFMILFGLPFLLSGLGILAATLGLLPVDVSELPLPVGLLMGGIFSCVGGIMVLGRSGCVIDSGNRKIARWWGLIIPLRQKEYSFSDFRTVKMTKEIRRTKDSTYTVFPVYFTGDDEEIKLHEGRDANDSRKMAEELATFIDLPLTDISSGDAVVRESRFLDESFRSRVERTGEICELPDPPEVMQSTIRKKGKAIMVEFPVPDNQLLRSLTLAGAVLLGVLTIGILLVVMSNVHGIDSELTWIVVGTVLCSEVVALFFVRKAILRGSGPGRIVVSPSDGIRVEARNKSGRTVKIPADEIEEISLIHAAEEGAQPETDKGGSSARGRMASLRQQGRGGIFVRSDEAQVQFGEKLPRSEQEYIRALVQHILIS